MWRRSLLIALILIGSAQLCATTDNGGMCRECGKMTMLGTKHICKGRRPKTLSQREEDAGIPLDCDLLTGKKLSDMQKALPLFDGFKVLGIEIVSEDYNGAKPCLKVSAGFGAVTRHNLREPEYSFERAAYEKAKAYYDKNILLLPVLPSGLSEMSEERLVSAVKPILDAIVADKRKAEEKIKNRARAKAQQKQKAEAIYDKLKELFGRSLFQKRQEKDRFSDDNFNGQYVEFAPTGEVKLDGWKCAYAVTPKDHRVYEISADSSEVSEGEMDKIIYALEMKYDAKFSNMGDGTLLIQGVNAKGNTRTLSVRKNGAGMRIALVDSAGVARAAAEGSVLEEHRRRENEEQLRRTPIPIWPDYIPKKERRSAGLHRNVEEIRANGASNLVWIVFVDTLTRMHDRFLAGEETPQIPLDGIVEREAEK